MIKLGTEITDPITGFRGVAYGRTVYINGCIRVGLQPKAVDNKLQAIEWFDENQLEGGVEELKEKGGPCEAPTIHDNPR